MVYPAKVLKIDEDRVLVKNPLGERFIRNDFVLDLKTRDWITTHYNYAAEKINFNQAKKILKRRKNE
jgi:hydrogenase maturation factor